MCGCADGTRAATRTRVRWLTCALLAGCTAPTPTAGSYLDDRAYRRAELEASLVDPSNGYSQLRLAEYALPSGGWDALPEWNPRAEPMLVAGDAPLSPTAVPLDLAIDPRDEAAMRALGELAFFQYPVETLPALADASYGVWTDPQRGLGGLVHYDAGGATAVAATCSSCHAASRAGALIAGLGNQRFDLGRLLVDAGQVDPANVAAYRAWGPGREDVTTITGGEPVRIPDLRAVRWLSYLQADADVLQRDLDVLAIRIETLLITQHPDARPPRIVTLAIATYLWSLADALPPAPGPSHGADLFAANCAGCHAPPSLTGEPVALDVVGTDPTLGLSAVRGTGMYRVTSLHGVAQRGLLLHDGSVASLSAMFDPARVTASFTGGVRPGAVPGHTYGLDLSDADRADLLAYLEDL